MTASGAADLLVAEGGGPYEVAGYTLAFLPPTLHANGPVVELQERFAPLSTGASGRRGGGHCSHPPGPGTTTCGWVSKIQPSISNGS